MTGGMGQAKEYCWSRGGHLVEIMSVEEENLLDSFLVHGISYWIGLTDEGHEGERIITFVPETDDEVLSGIYRWEENHQEAVYTNWAFSEPSNIDTENCVRKTYRIGYEGWHDVDCLLSSEEIFGDQHALCQMENV